MSLALLATMVRTQWQAVGLSVWKEGKDCRILHQLFCKTSSARLSSPTMPLAR